MAIKRRSANDISRLQADRRKHPQSRYKLEPHERRDLETLVKEQNRPVDADMVKTLSAYFVVTQGTIMQNLEGLGINTDLVAQGTSVPKPEPQIKPGRPTLHIGGKKKNKRVTKTTSKDLAAPEDLSGQALKEEQNKLRLAQVQLQQREAEIERKLRDMETQKTYWATIEADLAEYEELMAAQDRAHQEELAKIKANMVPRQPRNPDAEPIRLYSRGDIQQTILTMRRDHEVEVAGLRRSISLLEAALQHKEAERRMPQWTAEHVDGMQVM